MPLAGTVRKHLRCTLTRIMDRSARLGQGSIPRLLFEFLAAGHRGHDGPGPVRRHRPDLRGTGASGQIGIAGITVAFPFMLIVHGVRHADRLRGHGPDFHSPGRTEEGRGRAGARQRRWCCWWPSRSSITAVALPLLDPILVTFGASEHGPALRRAITCGSSCWATIFQMVGFGLNATIRGEGNPRVAMLSMLISVLVNVILGAAVHLRLRLGNERGRAGHGHRPGRLRRLGAGLFSQRHELAAAPRPQLAAEPARSASASSRWARRLGPCKSPPASFKAS